MASLFPCCPLASNFQPNGGVLAPRADKHSSSRSPLRRHPLVVSTVELTTPPKRVQGRLLDGFDA